MKPARKPRQIIRATAAATAVGLAALAGPPAWSAGPQLYSSGPSEDVAYVRFVNATGQPLDILATADSGKAGKNAKAGQLHLDVAKPASAYMGVKPRSALAGRAQQGKNSIALAPVANAGELVSVIVWQGADGKLGSTVIAELPKNFNGLKASVALYNADAACPAAGLAAADNNAMLFEKAVPGGLLRRPVNPVALKARASCGAAAVGQAMDLGTLEAGQRYSVFLVPDRSASRVLWARDEMPQ